MFNINLQINWGSIVFPAKLALYHFYLGPPKTVQIEITNICNLQCQMCPINRPGVEKSRAKKFMELDLFKKIIDDISGLKRCHIIPQGAGEPLLHKEFIPMLEYIRKYPQFTIGFDTNATMLDEPIIERILSLEVEEIGLSINASNENIYKELTGKEYFEKAIQNSEKLIEQREKKGLKKPKIQAILVETDLNKESISEYINFWLDRVDGVCILKERTETGRTLNFSLPEEYKSHLCLRLWETAVISCEGDMVLCCEDWKAEVKLGRLDKESLLDIWFGDGFSRIRYLHRLGQYDKVKICDNCYALYDEAPQIHFKDGMKFEDTFYYRKISRSAGKSSNLLKFLLPYGKKGN